MDISLYRTEVQGWISIISDNRGKDPRKVIEYSNKLQDYGTKKQDNALIAFAHFSKGETYYLLNDVKNFYTEMLSCIGPFESIKEWGYVAMANNLLGIMSLNRGQAPFAMEYYAKAINYCETYHLPDMEWMVHINVAALYLNIEEYQKAISHVESSLKYLLVHPELPDYAANLTVIYLTMGKAYLALDYESKAIECINKIKEQCLSYIFDIEKLLVYCLEARIYKHMGRMDKFNMCVELINKSMSIEMPIMDIFDDMYEYLLMLLEMERYDDFFKVYDLVEKLARATTVKHLEKKLLTLKLRYYKRTEQLEDYKMASCLFFEMSEAMEKENSLLINNMVVIKNSYDELAIIKKQIEEENETLTKESETDPLTGLYNRRKLNTYIEEAFQRAVDIQCGFGIEILDIDYFKQFNDNYGHQSGDDCIKFIANKIKSLDPGAGLFACRYGGDEFVIIYEGYTRSYVEELANKLKESIVGAAMEHKYSLCSDVVTISQGLCWDIPKSNQTASMFLKQADNMLYTVKEISRNSIKLGNIDGKQAFVK